MPTAPKSPQYLHIVTVGTSLLNRAGWRRGQSLPDKNDLLNLLEADPRVNSAELNAMQPFIDRGECTSVHLLATDTPESQLCRHALGLHLRDRGIQTNKVDAGGLLTNAMGQAVDQKSFHQAVRQLRDAIFRVADKAQKRGHTVFINATGGLKAETAVATLVAAELGISAYYIHESMAEPVFLPTATLDPTLLKALAKINADPGRRTRTLDPHMISRLEREGLIKVQRKADGEMSNLRLTNYAKYLL